MTKINIIKRGSQYKKYSKDVRILINGLNPYWYEACNALRAVASINEKVLLLQLMDMGRKNSKNIFNSPYDKD